MKISDSKTNSDKEDMPKDGDDSPFDEEEQAEKDNTIVESDLEKEVSIEKDMVNIDDIISNDNSPVERDVENVAKRLRSNKGKAVPSKVETPKAKNKIVGVGPKKG